MAGDFLELQPIQQTPSLTLRDIVATAFRHRRALLATFAGVLLAAVIITLLLPRSYGAHLKILVNNGRIDPLVSPEPNVAPPPPRDADLEQTIKSEAELLNSHDLLERVVVATGLDRIARTQVPDERMAVAIAAEKLARDLRVEPVAKTDLIEVSYTSPHPKLAADVLNTLGNLYLQKHVELHRTPGQQAFFSKLAEDYRQEVADAKAKLATSGQIAPSQMMDLAVHKYSESSAALLQTKAAIKETEKRIAGLQRENAVTPARVVTQMHRSDNQALLQQMKGTLLNLQLKRTELLTKYQPTYRPVQEVDKQIVDTLAAIQKEETAPAQEQTTDQNPTHAWIENELAKARADLVTFRGREQALAQLNRGYEATLRELQKNSSANDDLQRVVDTAQANYSLYVRKAEEARISEALDRNNILNVVIAEKATEPVLPTHSRLGYLLIGLLAASVSAMGLLFVAYHQDARYYRTPHEVIVSLQLPVFAALPRAREN